MTGSKTSDAWLPAGVVFYNYTKLQNMQAKQREKEAQKAAGDVEKAPLVSPTQSSPAKQ